MKMRLLEGKIYATVCIVGKESVSFTEVLSSLAEFNPFYDS